MNVDPLARTEVRIGRLLTIGTRVSTTLLAVGLRSRCLCRCRTPLTALLALGLVVLMATPVARVVASVAVPWPA